MRVNETKQAPEFREQSRKKALLELQSYKKELLQVFNRGMSSSGHLSNEANRNLVYKEV